jgi:hypothetical protein
MKQDLLNILAGTTGMAFGWMLPALLGTLRVWRNGQPHATNPHEPNPETRKDTLGG